MLDVLALCVHGYARGHVRPIAWPPRAPCQSIALAQPGNPQRLVDRADGGAPLHRLLQQREASVTCPDRA